MRRVIGKATTRLVLAFGLGMALRRVVGTLRAAPRWNRLGARVASVGTIPWRGWRAVLADTLQALLAGDHLSKAAAIAFYALLSLVPSISVLVTIYGLFSDPLNVVEQLGPFLAALPDAAAGVVTEQARRIASIPRGQLSLNLVLSFLIAAWTANSATKALFDSLNRLYGQRETRSFLKLNTISMATTVSIVIVFMLLMVSVALLPTLSLFEPLVDANWATLAMLRWPLMAILAFGLVIVIYTVGLSQRPAESEWLVPGAMVAVGLGSLMSFGFSAYVSKIASYTAAYGSLAAIVIFLTWLWLSALSLIIGAQFNASIARLVGRNDRHSA
ncbi:MAG: YihY/virulence factor BrkB family protein [Beijerinckiaceae bacterium]|nr:YihY/virulence factor BrkB family protein [Beijerinckiaceae bacterium]MCZ8300607.1 YihY/virulence factor BrkB family protein [Beijerinckiaceae bacterium]